MEVRFPYAAGFFYPMNREELVRTIEECFISEFGPGEIPKKRFIEEFKVIAGIVPHAGYKYSGPCAAWFYKRLFESSTEFETVVILGTNHSGLGENISTLVSKDWRTPLGIVKTDKKLGKTLLELGTGFIFEDEEPHIYEHSIEVQLPFLQYLFKEFKIVPIVVKHLDLTEVKRLANIILQSSQKLGKNIIVLASSDFTHHGLNYAYVKFIENPNDGVKRMDLDYIDSIINLNAEEFLNKIERNLGTVCGYSAIATVVEYSKQIGARANLLKYYTSADITGDNLSIVGYGSISFEIF